MMAILPHKFQETLQRNLFERLLILITCFGMWYFFIPKEDHITSDGKGYYNHLPAVFIYNDINFNYLDTLKTDYYDHAQDANSMMHNLDGRRYTKYFVGTSICQAPFFFIAHLYTKTTHPHIANGYSKPYQTAIWISAWFYLLIGLVAIRKWLLLLKFSASAIRFSQVIIVFTAPTLLYVYHSSAYSHIFSFAIITLFLYHCTQFIQEKKQSQLAISALFFGLVLLIRPTNAIVLFGVLLAFKDFDSFKIFIKNELSIKRILLFTVISIAVFSVQCLLYYFQIGHFWVYSYTTETFNWLHPEWVNWLFSTRKGLFFYSPFLLFILIASTLSLLSHKKAFLISSIYLIFLLIAWVNAAWWCWWFGASFGQRVIIDHLYLFGFLGAICWQNASANWKKLSLFALLMIFSTVNLIQLIQWDRYIIRWDNMTWDNYTATFLNTNWKLVGYTEHQSSAPLSKVYLNHIKNSNSFVDSLQKHSIARFNVGNNLDSNSTFFDLRLIADLGTGECAFGITYFDKDDKELKFDYQSTYFFTNGKTGLLNSYMTFQLPDKKEDIEYIQIWIDKRTEPIKIKSTTFHFFRIK